MDFLSELNQDNQKIVNVASVPQRSPFRYPGGKTWLVPTVRSWLKDLGFRPKVFIEPFAGGGITGITVAAEDLADRVIMVEKDELVASVWQTIFSNRAKWLIDQILKFKISRESVVDELNKPTQTIHQLAFKTIIRNRTQRGGIMAPGASLVKTGENGKGIASRWYPETLANRISYLHQIRDRIEFIEGDCFQLLPRFKGASDSVFFVDPPYTVGGKKAGSRLYSHSQIDHQRLIKMLSSFSGACMLTYDENSEIRTLASANGFTVHSIPMKNTHHNTMRELIILKERKQTRGKPLSMVVNNTRATLRSLKPAAIAG